MGPLDQFIHYYVSLTHSVGFIFPEEFPVNSIRAKEEIKSCIKYIEENATRTFYGILFHHMVWEHVLHSKLPYFDRSGCVVQRDPSSCKIGHSASYLLTYLLATYYVCHSFTTWLDLVIKFTSTFLSSIVVTCLGPFGWWVGQGAHVIGVINRSSRPSYWNLLYTTHKTELWRENVALKEPNGQSSGLNL